MNNLFNMLERASLEKSVDFWRELCSQVLYPVLEDIQLAVETDQNPSIDDENVAFYQEILESIFERFAIFLNEFYKNMPKVVSIYIDIICLFISNVSNKRIANVTAKSLVNLINTIGDKLSQEEWDNFTTSLCLCVDSTLPKSLVTNEPGNLDHQLARCLVQLQLINCISESFKKHSKQFNQNNTR